MVVRLHRGLEFTNQTQKDDSLAYRNSTFLDWNSLNVQNFRNVGGAPWRKIWCTVESPCCTSSSGNTIFFH